MMVNVVGNNGYGQPREHWVGAIKAAIIAGHCPSLPIQHQTARHKLYYIEPTIQILIQILIHTNTNTNT